MKDQILSYREMCDQESIQTLQRGMNYRLHPEYSVILMSQRSNAPYNDKILDDGYSIEYEGHDIPNYKDGADPKKVDQPRTTKNGKLTQNGQFEKAIIEYKSGNRDPELVRAYEKLFSGIWSEKGFFVLVDYRYETDENNRKVFKFILEETEVELSGDCAVVNSEKPRSRIIPSEIKLEVWKRDNGQCVLCGSEDELHFDHDLPYSKGGSSITSENVRILCARHNLEKSDKIE